MQFILSHGEEHIWPTHHRMEFWNQAALFVAGQAGTSHQRSGKHYFQHLAMKIHAKNNFSGPSCRFKVVKGLKKKFSNPKSASVFCSSVRVSLGVQATAPCVSVELQVGTGSITSTDVGVQTDGGAVCSVATQASHAPISNDVGVQVSVEPEESLELPAISVAFAEHCKNILKVSGIYI